MSASDRPLDNGATRIVVADGLPLIRAGMRCVLEREVGMEVVAEAARAEEVQKHVREVRPHVLVLDVGLEGKDFAEALQLVQDTSPHCHVLVVSGLRGRDFAIRTLRAGARGYLTKTRPIDDLVRAVRTVAAGERFVASEVAHDLARSLAGDEDCELQERLSDREFQVFCLLGSGRTVKEIGELLHLSPKTVSTYRARTLDKTGLRSNAEIIRYAVHNGLVA